MWFSRWPVSILAMVGSACAGATAPSPPGDLMSIDFTVQESSALFALSPVRVELDGSNRLNLSGTFETPCLHYLATAKALRLADTLRLTVEAYLPAQLCQTQIAVLSFTTRFPLLPPGSYHLRLIRAFKEWPPWPPQTLLDSTVVIP